MSENLEPIIEAAASLKGIKAEEVAETLKSEDGYDPGKVAEFIKSAAAERVKATKTETYDEAYNKAQKEISNKWESRVLKATGFQPSEPLKGDELVSGAFEHFKSQFKPSNKEVTEADVIGHPLYQKTKAELESSINDWQEKFNTIEQKTKYETVFNTVSAKALAIIKAKNPVDTDADVLNSWNRVMLEGLRNYNYQVNGDQITALDSENNVVKDDLGHPVSFEDLVARHSKAHLFKKSSDKSSPDGGDDKGAVSFPKPNNEAEYSRLIARDSDLSSEQRIALVDWVKGKRQEGSLGW